MPLPYSIFAFVLFGICIRSINAAPPVWTNCPNSTEVYTDPGADNTTVPWEDPTATDDATPTANLIIIISPKDIDIDKVFEIGTTDVTYTAVDDEDPPLTGTCKFSVTVIDNENPVVVGCPSNVVNTTEPGLPSRVVVWDEPTVSDNSGMFTDAKTHTSGSTFGIGMMTVTLTFTDLSSNSESCTFTVTINDEEPPETSNCPTVDLQIISGSELNAGVTWDEPTFTDNSGDPPEVNKTAEPGSMFVIGETLVTYTAEDSSGNQDTCVINVTVVQDTEPPIFVSCPDNIEVDTLEGLNYTVVNFTAPTATDNYELASLEQQDNYLPEGDTYYIGVTTIRYVALDSVSQITDCIFTITVLDNEKPNITCPANISQTTDPMSNIATVMWSDAVATDNTDGVLPVYGSQSSPDEFPIGQSKVTYNATDSNNNTAECSFYIDISDEEPPVFTFCPSDMSVGNDPGTYNATVTWDSPNATDNSLMTVTLTPSHEIGSVFPLGNTTVTYNATDPFGNVNTNCSFLVTVSDTEPPMTEDCLENITTNTDNGENFATGITWMEPVFTDNSGVAPTVNSSHVYSDSTFEYPIGTTVVTYNATDDVGNLGQCIFPIIVIDDEAPIFTECPGDMMEDTDPGSATAMITWSEVQATDNSGIMPTVESNYANGTEFPIGSTLVMYNASDSFGNINETCTFWINITDNEAPVFTSCPVDIDTETDPGSPTAVETWDEVNATDNSMEDPTILSNYESGFAFPIGVTTVEYNATDGYGNVNLTCVFNVTVTDMEPPEFTNCPSDITNETDPGSPDRVVEWANVTAEDNSELPVTIMGTHTSGDSFPIGSTTVMFNATDEAGNVNTTCEFVINIEDKEPPVFTECPMDMSEDTDPGLATADVTWPDVNATDNSGENPTILSNYNSGDTFSIGSTLVLYNATDLAGNVNDTCQFFINITDNEAPVFTFCPSDNTSTTSAGVDWMEMTWMAPEATDNSGQPPTFNPSHNSGDMFYFGETIVQINASDSAGNINSSCTFIITITDDEMPTTSNCTDDQNVTTDASEMFATGVNWDLPLFEDNVDDTSVLVITESQMSDVATMFNIGATEITINATDLSNNTGTCTFYIYVTDMEPPVFTFCPDDQSINTTEGENTGMTTWSFPTAEDNSGDAPTIVGTHNDTFEFPAGDTTVQYTATDGYGNVNDTCTFTITVEDKEAPIITFCPDDVQESTEQTTNNTAVMWLPVTTATDNSGEAPNITTNIQQGDVLSIGNYTVLVTATDGSGNTNTTCSFNIEVIDNVPPVLTCPNDTTVMLGNTSSTANVNWTEAEVFDNSGQAVSLSSSPKMSGDEFGIGTFLITYTAVDAYGNEATCTFTVTVRDLESPYFENCTESFTVGTDPGLPTATVTWEEPIAMDNNGINRTDQNYYPGDEFNTTSSPYRVVYVAYDESNNNATCEFEITVLDMESPNITCPDNITVETMPGDTTGDVIWSVPMPMDNVALIDPIPVESNGYMPGQFPITTLEAVTYTAEDTSGNTAMCTFYFVVEDKEPPVIMDCPMDLNQTTDSGVNYTTVSWTAPTATDNSGSPTLTPTNAIGSVFYIGDTVVTYTAEDGYMNTATCNFTVTIIDNEPPTFTCPDSFNINTTMNSNTTNATWMYPLYMDNSYEVVTVTESHTSPSILLIGVHEVTYNFTDIYMNTASCSFNITVNDFEDPEVIFCPSDYHNNTESGLPYANITWSEPIVEDNSGFFTITQQTNMPGDGFMIGVTTVEYIFTDSNMNSNDCTFMVNITDIENPTINCPMHITAAADQGTTQTTVTWSSPTTSDNDYDVVSLNVDMSNGSTFNVGVTVVTYEATDRSGNMEFCSFNVTVEDQEDPVVSGCPENFTLPTDDDEDDRVTYWTEPTATDNSGTVDVSQSHMNGSTFPIGNTIVTYNFSDPSGNIASCEFIITIIDIELPVPNTCPDNETYSTDSGVDTRQDVSWSPVPQFTDNAHTMGGVSTGLSYDNNINSGSNTFQLGTTEVWYSATDYSGNTGFCRFYITIIDTELPMVTCPSDITVNSTEGEATAVVNYTAMAMDNVDVTTENFDIPSGSDFPFGVTNVTFMALDAAGNEGNCTFTVTVQDFEPPEFTNCPNNLTSTTDNMVNYTMITWPTIVATDNSLQTPDIQGTHQSNDNFYIGTVEVTFTAVDDAGNEATCSFLVTVEDDEAPVVMNCSNDISQMADAGTNTSSVTWSTPYATDNSYEEPMMDSSHSSGDVFEFGTTTVVYNFTDAAGNLGQCIFDVTITDDEKPMFENCPNDTNAVTDYDDDTSLQMWIDPTASDNNGIQDVMQSHTSPHMFSIGETNVTYVATDVSGNTAVCYFIVNITDQQNPNVTCPSLSPMDTMSGESTVDVTWPTPDNSDNDAVANVISDPSSGSTFSVGDTNVTVTVTDASGNTASCIFTVTIVDPEPPVISDCPDNINATTDMDQNYTAITWVEPTATDNDGMPTSTRNFAPGSDFEIGNHTVLYVFSDSSGNEANCSFTITIIDDQNPETSNCPNDIMDSTDSMSNNASGITWTEPTFTDNSNQPVTVTISGSTGPPDSFPIGISYVNYTGTDESGNFLVCSFIVNITDDEPPTIVTPCPGDITNTTDYYDTPPRVLWTPPTATDNSGSVTTASTHMPNDTFPVGFEIVTTVTYTFTDDSDNSISCSFDVEIADNIPPYFINFPNDTTVYTLMGENYTEVTWTPPTAEDNSGTAFSAGLIQPGVILEIGTYTASYVAIDLSNNAIRQSFTITVVDNEPPVIHNSNADPVIEFTDSGTTVTNVWVMPYADDNSNQPVNIECDADPGDALAIGEHNITCNSTDPYGNTADVTIRIIIYETDNEPPVVTCPESFSIPTDMGSDSVSVTWEEVTATDNYDVFNLTGSHVNDSIFSLGPTLVEYTAFDISGNEGECNFTVDVIDEEDPVIDVCPGSITQDTDMGESYAVVSITDPTFTDNSGSVSLSKNPNTNNFQIGTTTVTFTVTDASGNSVTCQLDVIIEDNEPPTIVHCPNDIQESNSAGENYAVVSWTAANATDNDEIVNTYMSANSDDQFVVGTTTVNVTWVDQSGNVATCLFDVEVRDVDPPVWTDCPTSEIRQMTPSNTNVSAVFWTTPQATDNVGVTFNDSNKNSGDIFELGVTTVTYTAEDAAGNIKQCVFTVLVVDTDSPVFSTCAMLQPSITNTTKPGEAVGVMYWEIPMATDNDGVMNVDATSMPGDEFPYGPTTVTYTATDDSGNIGTCSFQVVITDSENPVLSNCPNDTVVEPMSGSDVVFVTWIEPVATDNVDMNPNVLSSYSPNQNLTIGFYPVTYTATDQSGNSDTCSFFVTVTDTTPPVLMNCPSNITQPTDPGQNFAVVTWTPPTYTDNTETVRLMSTYNPMDQFPFAFGSQTSVVYQATDASGNSDTCLFTITILDEESPVFTSCAANQTVNAPDTGRTQMVTWSDADVTDNVLVILQLSDPISGSSFDVGETEVVITARDYSGNTAMCSFYVTVNDVTAPVFDPCPAPLAFSTDLGSSTATAVWNNLNIFDNVGVATSYSSHASGVLLPPGVTTIYNNATDEAGNSAECTFDITVTDDEDPVFATCPETFSVTASEDSTMTTVTWDISEATDNVGVVSTTNTSSSGESFMVGTYIITYTATDAAGNSAQCQFTLVVLDYSAPTFENCSNGMTVDTNMGESGTNVYWMTPTAMDNSGNVVSTSMTPEIQPNSYLNIGTYNINYTAVDSAGNRGYCLFTIVVQDVEDPVIVTCPNNVVTLPDPGSSNANVNFTKPTATDNSGTVFENAMYPPNSVFGPGVTTVTYTFTDEANNQNTCSFTITVQDNIAPVIMNCPDSIENNTAPGEANRLITWDEPDITDNAGVALVDKTHVPNTYFSIGTTYVNYTATDYFGNQEVCFFLVIVIDDEDPVLTGCPSDQQVYTDPDEITATVTWTEPTSSDNSGTSTTISTYPSGYAFGIGDTVVTYTASDTSDNRVECSFTIHVTDNQPPVVSNCPNNILRDTDSGSPTAVITWTEPTFEDNVDGILTATRQIQPGSAFAVGTVTNTYQATDSEGNSANCVFTITVRDQEPPVFTGCPDVIIANETNRVFWQPPLATDNTVIVTLKSDHSSGTAYPTGITSVTYTARDQYDNLAYCIFNLDVSGVGAPVITSCPDSFSVVASEATSTANPTWTTPEANDEGVAVSPDCGGQVSGATLSVGSTAVVCVFTSDSGLESVCQFTITVEEFPDTVSPVLQNCPGDINMEAPIGDSSVLVSWTPPTASDNSDPTPDLQTTIGPNSQFSLGTTVVQYTATDASSNQAHCSFTVTVTGTIDTEAPVINCPSDVNQFVSDGTTQFPVTWTEPEVTDNSEIITSVGSNIASGEQFVVGQTIVTYTAVDGSGNEAQCSFTVTVAIDNEEPELIYCPTDITQTVLSSSGVTSATVTWTTPSYTDNSESFTVSANPDVESGSTFTGSTVIVYTAQDNFGNANTECRFTITVIVDDPPTFTYCPDNQQLTTDIGMATTTATWTTPIAQDDIDSDVTVDSQFVSDETLFNIGVNTVVYTAVDSRSNTAICQFTITVTDEEGPVFLTTPPNPVTAGVYGQTSTTVQWTEPTASDNSGLSPVITLTGGTNGGSFNIGTTALTYTATDSSGNQVTYSFNVEVIETEDTEPPVFTSFCPATITGTTEAGQAVGEVSWNMPTATDNLATDVVITPQLTTGSYPIGMSEVVFTASDGVNTAMCTITITISDNENPTITNGCPESQTFNIPESGYTIEWTWTVPTFTDNSGDDVVVTVDENEVADVLTVTYVGTDSSQNSLTCTFTYDRQVVADPATNAAELTFLSIGGILASNFPNNVDLDALLLDLDTLLRASDISESFVGISDITFDSEDGSVTNFNVLVTSDSNLSPSDIEDAFYAALDGSTTFSGNTISEDTFFIGDGDCTNSPCQNDGICTRTRTSYTCACVTGFEGNNCQTDIDECSDSSICTGGEVCTNTVGGYSCACPYGFAKAPGSDICTIQLRFNGAFTLEEYDGNIATFQQDLKDPSSELYMYLATKIIDALTPLFNSITGFIGVQIGSFESGSIIVEYVLNFELDSSATDTMLDTMFLDNVNGTGHITNSDLVLDLNSIQSFSEICPDDYCKNGGTCDISTVTFESECTCTNGWSGTTCTDKSGLETWEIAVIASGGALFVLIILITAAICCCCFLGGGRYNQHMYDEEFHIRDSYRHATKERLYDNYYNNDNYHPDHIPRFNDDENFYDNRGSRFFHEANGPERHFSRPFVVSGDELSDPRYSPRL